MSTLGFGDITFESDLGRVFSIVVLLTGIFVLLIVLPFSFIRFFYAPWLEAQVRARAPRKVAETTSDHVIICELDPVGRGLIERLNERGVPYVVIESDVTVAADLHGDGISVATGEPDDPQFMARLGVQRARLVFANREDTVNTGIALTVHEVAPRVPVAAVSSRNASEDVLEMSGASAVLPLKRWLGEHLANRVGGTHAGANVVGSYRDLLVAEVPARHTPLVRRTLREARLRESTGVSVVGLWERGRLLPASPDSRFSDQTVAVVTGTRDQLDDLDDLLAIYDANPNPVVVIGAGRVGRAAARALRSKDVAVHLVERDPALAARVRSEFTVFEGDAAERELLEAAGLLAAPASVLTTHDDAMNIYLASYCRHLNPDLRIVSRITLERNVESVHRAGADFALSYTALGVAAVWAHLVGRPLTILGGDFDLQAIPVPARLAGRTLADSEIGARTGLSVLAIDDGGDVLTSPPPGAVLPAGASLVVLGDRSQRAAFESAFG
jgi:Trk K+ transport system NAD-binding subunit